MNLQNTAEAARPIATVPRSSPAPVPVSQWVRGVKYARSATVVTLSKGMFLFFTIAMPVAMFLLFNGLFGQEQEGNTTVGTLIMIRMEAYGGPDPLTDAEARALRTAADGAPNAQIAATVFLTEGTVRNYMSAAMAKLGATNRVEAVRVATENGWL